MAGTISTPTANTAFHSMSMVKNITEEGGDMSGRPDTIGQCKLKRCGPAHHAILILYTPITEIRAARRDRYVTTKEPAERSCATKRRG